MQVRSFQTAHSSERKIFLQGSRGGVRVVFSPEEVESAAQDMIGDFLITKQTGAAGRQDGAIFSAARAPF